MATRLLCPHQDGDLGDEEPSVISLELSPLGRSRSRRKRKMQEMEEKRRIRGDSHWSKVLQVNKESKTMRHKRYSRFCNGVTIGESPGCGIGIRLGRGITGGNRFLSNLSMRVRVWLQSKRKYEVSPEDDLSPSDRIPGGAPASEAEGHPHPSRKGRNSLHSLRGAELIKEDYIIISQVNNYHPELKRCEATSIGITQTTLGYTHPHHHRKYSNNFLTMSAPGCTTAKSNTMNDRGSMMTVKHPLVNINIEFADHDPYQGRSHFVANPLRLDQAPKTQVITPSTRALSRSQQLRQSRNKYLKLLQKAGQLSPGRTPLTGTISAPAKHGIESKSSPTTKSRRIKTWPLPCRKQMKATVEDDPCLGDSDTELPFIQEMNYDKFGLRGKSSLKDFSIDFKDLNLGELSKKGRRVKLYKGKWHGDVIVHVFGELRQKDKDAFWANLGKLCRIRHENIILFMAACTNPPNLAVVTCNPQGKSLYDYIHVQKEKTTMHTKIHVLRQIALGMGYLHAKDIVLRKLNSKNVFIGHRVKVSAMDFGFLDSSHDRPNYGSIPRGHLTYIAPEILTGIRVIPPRLTPTAPYTPESDVYAFGTIMYEVLTGKFPFHNAAPETIIWQVCYGNRQILYSVKCSAAVKSLIEDCWSHEPLYRPEFRELCKDLQRHSPLHKKHSSSEPRLHTGTEYLES